MAKRTKGDSDEVLPVRKEWVAQVSSRLESEGRGAQAKLADAVGISTGALAELLAVERDGTPKSKYSKYVKRIDHYFGWGPSMMPVSPDTQEVQYLLDGIGAEAVDLLRALKDMDPGERDAFVKLILARRKS